MSDNVAHVVATVSGGATVGVGTVTVMGWLNDNYSAIAAACLIATTLTTIAGVVISHYIKLKRLKIDIENGYTKREGDPRVERR